MAPQLFAETLFPEFFDEQDIQNPRRNRNLNQDENAD